MQRPYERWSSKTFFYVAQPSLDLQKCYENSHEAAGPRRSRLFEERPRREHFAQSGLGCPPPRKPMFDAWSDIIASRWQNMTRMRYSVAHSGPGRGFYQVSFFGGDITCEQALFKSRSHGRRYLPSVDLVRIRGAIIKSRTDKEDMRKHGRFLRRITKLQYTWCISLFTREDLFISASRHGFCHRHRVLVPGSIATIPISPDTRLFVETNHTIIIDESQKKYTARIETRQCLTSHLRCRKNIDEKELRAPFRNNIPSY